jgi:hypothetical protein
MLTRVALSTILASGLFTISAALTQNNGAVASATAVHRSDDPVPCPDCGPELSLKRSDDPVPCPDCGPESK